MLNNFGGVIMRLIEVLLNPETKEIRVSFRIKNFVIVVKTFDPDMPGLTSVKLFNRPECYERTKSFWKTRVCLPKTGQSRIVQDARNILNRYIGEIISTVIIHG